ncbi:hypothetical protein NUW54_g9445 [Trametes sanguinea]|uniref:Uncharacterized protein n=1 Tax=Trametes sanguinea TaxID=158606 RepID=A0ACC1P6T7_9APHY|nr:hypothetical protein NUW54_g9445 [Trametes sanguinea]
MLVAATGPSGQGLVEGLIVDAFVPRITYGKLVKRPDAPPPGAASDQGQGDASGEGEGEGEGAARKKKKRKINLFPTAQATSFEWNIAEIRADMIWDALADSLLKSWEWLAFWRNSPPALLNMRLRPTSNDENALMVQFFTWESLHPEMSWWRHFETQIPDLAALGTTQVWLPPPNKAMRKVRHCSLRRRSKARLNNLQEGQGYDAYDLWDLGEFYQKGTIATRWGTKEELVHAIATANAHGIDVLIDAVLNHKLGADRPEKFMAVPVDPNNRLKDIGPAREIEGWTAFDFLGRGDKYSTFKWTHEHFTGLDWDHRSRTKGVFRIASSRHQGWSRWVDTELGNYDYLLGIDINHRHPDVRRDLFAWGAWVLQTTGGAGFRLDAIKHMDRRFLLSFIKQVREELGRNDLFSVAEYWSSDLEPIKPYIRAFEGLVTFFDVPLHYNFHEASKAGSRYDLRRILDKTILKYRPSDSVTFVDNHDTQVGQTLESWVRHAAALVPAFKHPSHLGSHPRSVAISSSRHTPSYCSIAKATREYHCPPFARVNQPRLTFLLFAFPRIPPKMRLLLGPLS